MILAGIETRHGASVSILFFLKFVTGLRKRVRNIFVFRLTLTLKLDVASTSTHLCTQSDDATMSDRGAHRHCVEDHMAKTNVIQIRLVSTADTGYFYVTKKNARSAVGKMEVRKYDPVVRKHVTFREAKIK